MAFDPNLLSRGIRHHEAGQPQEAYELYRQALAAEPTNATVLSLLGAACIHLKRFDEAAGYLAEAIAHDPGHQAAHDNLGVLLARQGRMAEAAASFRRAAELDPNHARTQLNLAAALERSGQREAAIEAYRTAAQLAPDLLRANVEAARLLRSLGRAAEAVPYFRQIARLKHEDAQSRFELAAALAEAGQTGEAITSYQETLALKPDSAESCVNLAALYIARREYDEAASWARRAVQMRPAFAEAYLNLGSALSSLKRHDEAEQALREAIRLKPGLAQAYHNLGIVLADAQKLEAAEAEYRRGLAIAPDSPEGNYNLGIVLLKRNEVAAALEHFERALAARPSYAEAHHNRASALLLSGRLAEGLAEYEWRFRSRDFPAFRPRWKLWDGSDPRGKTIVLVAEQGLGDTLQFVRYAKLLADRGARVIVECPAALHPVLARTKGVSQWITATDPPPPADGCVALLSMPYRLGTTLETIPADVPYLFADPQRERAWRGRLAQTKGLRVGIAWQGNPFCPGDAQRSIPLEQFEPLARIEGVRLVSLQKGAGEPALERVAEAWNVVRFGERLDAEGGAFVDTAAIIRNLDLVITSDTAMAHLAGGLGARTWVALQHVPDWRWLLERADSPWYPTMRLFRQRARGDWGEVFARIAGELRAMVAAA